jgi:NAD(P)-dependent dehydrogenase (short-subunit alcohol dehydrogenase family)
MKSVLVTGGTTRLGKAIADFLRSAGWRVLTTSHRADAAADILADFSTPLGPARAYAEALRLLGGNPPDALVNNAALFTGDATTLEAVNFTAPQKLTILMAGRETGRGSVVNILDSRVLNWGQTPSDDWGQTPYESTKLRLLEETRRFAQLFAATLRVNAVAPGPVLAPVGVREAAGETLVGRPTTEDVARAVAYLLDAKATTGAVLPVDGGQHLLGQ